ncbi:aminotransferase class V-fold PLP-dependent enzyme [Niallia sp. 03133]|uniref:aminotransferase class V-fold PLP-dependent enzyme n=1 Tax=Niallia sp. 03133 TaxID=3458060 RepID=UPI004043B612
MKSQSTIIFKKADLAHEIEQIHQLNYETFVEEIPQHKKNQEKLLVDSYHKLNTYLIALAGNEVIGMIAINTKRPFSLDKKLGNIDHYLPNAPKNICEVRLLSIRKQYRKTTVFVGLMQCLLNYCLQNELDAAVISGTLRQLKLYKHMGFVSFAHLVGTDEAPYQPMYIKTLEFKKGSKVFAKQAAFLPGPVNATPNVMRAFASEVIPHRDQDFYKKMKKVQQMLCELTSAKHVQVLLGTGTLANDCIAAQLQLLNEKGLILSNGEFGERLIDRAKRFGLKYEFVKKEWGQYFTEKELNEAAARDINWIWFVHCETSTGMINSIAQIATVCRNSNIKLVVDCISSLGAVPVDLKPVYLASGVSGKGVGSITGLSFVFHHHDIKSSDSLPPYLDLGAYMEKESVPYSHSSHLVAALEESLKDDVVKRFLKVENMYLHIYNRLLEEGFSVITQKEDAAYAILTLEIDSEISSKLIGDMMKLQGYILHYESSYLIKRNWIQIATIGNVSRTETKQMIRTLSLIVKYMKQHEKSLPKVVL